MVICNSYVSLPEGNLKAMEEVLLIVEQYPPACRQDGRCHPECRLITATVLPGERMESRGIEGKKIPSGND